MNTVILTWVVVIAITSLYFILKQSSNIRYWLLGGWFLVLFTILASTSLVSQELPEELGGGQTHNNSYVPKHNEVSAPVLTQSEKNILEESRTRMKSTLQE
jgi:hypothetical protein